MLGSLLVLVLGGAAQLNLKAVALTVMVLAVTVGSYTKGRLDQAGIDRSHILADELAAVRAAFQRNQSAAVDASDRAGDLTAGAAALQEKVSLYEAELAARPKSCAPADAGLCRLDDAGARRLRDIAAGCASVGGRSRPAAAAGVSRTCEAADIKAGDDVTVLAGRLLAALVTANDRLSQTRAWYLDLGRKR